MRKLLVFIAFIAVSLPHISYAQNVGAAIFGPPKKEEVIAPVAPAPAIPPDEFGRETPRGTLTGFINALSKSDYEKASNYLDLSYLSSSQAETQGPELAKDLQMLMDNGAWITPSSMISDNILGNLEDGLNDGQERLGTLKTRNETVDLLAEKSTNNDHVDIWLISSDTMKRVPSLVRHSSESKIDQVLPDSLLEPKFAGVPIGHWVAMLGLVGASYLFTWFAVRGIAAFTRRCWKNTDPTQKKHVIDAFELPVRIYIATWVFVFTAAEIGISVVARQYFSKLTMIVAGLSLALLLWRLIDVIAETYQKKMIVRGKYGALSGVQFFRRTAKFIFICIAIFLSFDAAGIDVTTALAALGIGGLAIAFGAQKTVENFIGSIMVIFDQPIRIGDYCKVGDIQGTVEDIGMRSTRIRTLERTLVTIPNGDFSSQRIENYNQRDQFRIFNKLSFLMDTSADQLRFLLVEIRALLYAHPRIDGKSAYVRLVGWSSDSVVIEMNAYVMTRNNDDFMEVREDIFLRIMDIVAKSGTGFTVTATTLPQGSSTDLQSLKEAAEQKIRDLREKGELPLPKFDQAKIDQVRNTIEYPPKGSSAYKGKKE